MINFITAEISSDDPTKAQVLELVAAITDDQFNVAKLSPVLVVHRDVDLPMDNHRYDIYTKNGLLDECNVTTRKEHTVDDLLLEWVGHSNTFSRWKTIWSNPTELYTVQNKLPAFAKKLNKNEFMAAWPEVQRFSVPARALERVLYNISVLKTFVKSVT